MRLHVPPELAKSDHVLIAEREVTPYYFDHSYPTKANFVWD